MKDDNIINLHEPVLNSDLSRKTKEVMLSLKDKQEIQKESLLLAGLQKAVNDNKELKIVK